MTAKCTSCETSAGPTIRITLDTVTGPQRLALTLGQAYDLEQQLVLAIDRLTAVAE